MSLEHISIRLLRNVQNKSFNRTTILQWLVIPLMALLLTACGGGGGGTTTIPTAARMQMGGSIQGTPLSLTPASAVVITLAGSGVAGASDGTITAATFNNPYGMTTDGINLYVADANNNKIRKIVIATGSVSTLAGSGAPGATDGTGTAATFNFPYGITTDDTSLYIADTANNKIRKILQ